MQLSLTSYQDFLKENKLSTDAKNTARIKNIGKKIAQAVETYLKSQGMESRIEGFNWEFNLVQSKEMNAWCMPGGKVVFTKEFYRYVKLMLGLLLSWGMR